MKWEGPSHYVLGPWGEETITFIPTPGIVDGHVVIESDKREERRASVLLKMVNCTSLIILSSWARL